ncbi:MAG TPA: hypothetical protein VGX70_00660, partial [Gemmataceae bacterium]|nr:hypothetical protein [Gemmataceae bacterium]
LVGQPPKVAGQQYAQSALHDLAEGDLQDETNASSRHPGVHPLWLVVLGGILGLSLILNVVLVLSRK